jgi:hypothetical protein
MRNLRHPRRFFDSKGVIEGVAPKMPRKIALRIQTDLRSTLAAHAIKKGIKGSPEVSTRLNLQALPAWRSNFSTPRASSASIHSATQPFVPVVAKLICRGAHTARVQKLLVLVFRERQMERHTFRT